MASFWNVAIALDEAVEYFVVASWTRVETFVLTAWLFVIIPKGFIPTEDTGQIFAFTEASQDISFDAMTDKQRAAAAIVLKQPYIDQIMSSIGASTINVVPNTGRIFMRLKPRDQRPPADKIIEDLRPKLAAIPGFRVDRKSVV